MAEAAREATVAEGAPVAASEAAPEAASAREAALEAGRPTLRCPRRRPRQRPRRRPRRRLRRRPIRGDVGRGSVRGGAAAALQTAPRAGGSRRNDCGDVRGAWSDVASGRPPWWWPPTPRTWRSMPGRSGRVAGAGARPFEAPPASGHCDASAKPAPLSKSRARARARAPQYIHAKILNTQSSNQTRRARS